MKTVAFLKSIAACDLKDGTCIQLIELMMVSNEGQCHFLTFAQGHLHLKIKTGFSQIPLDHFELNLYVSCQVQGNKNMLT